MSKKPQVVLPSICPHDISTDGRAVARDEGKVVFISGAVPGDVVEAVVRKKKAAFSEADTVRVIEPSPDRVTPVCEHFGTCGGCRWQHLDYKAQLRYKEKFVYDAITRIGKTSVADFRPIIGSGEQYYYRNKLEYTFSAYRWLTTEELTAAPEDRRGLGFHIPGKFDKILDIRNCYLQADPSNAIRIAVRQFALENGLSFFDLRNQAGFLRTLMIRSTRSGDMMVLVTVFEWDEPRLFELLRFIRDNFPSVTSLLYAHNPKGNDTLAGLDIQVFSGDDHLIEEMEGLRFKVSARSFYQTNSMQARELYRITREFAGLTGDEVVYDLYTGTGTIANFVASRARSVAGLEYVEDAVEDARENARFNGITNVSFHAGDMKDLLTAEFFSKQGKPDVIITDPPRAGMHEHVVRAILSSGAKRVVYVSCNPGTQARDIQILCEKYEVSALQPVDMFPQTTHVESVALLNLRDVTRR